MIPAPSRRAMIPTTFSTATSMIARKLIASEAVTTSPSRMLGTITCSVMAPKT